MIKKEYMNIIVLWQFLIIINSSSEAITNNEESPQDDIKNELLKQGQFFRDLFSEQLSEHEIEFGHVCENPDEWEQRFERQDIKANNYRGKVKWGNKNGEYGEHYWDLNH